MELVDHSFRIFGKQGDVLLVYYSPAKASETPDNLLTYKAHFDRLKGRKWIWIVDFANMKSSDYISFSLMKKLIALLQEEHSTTLLSIIAVHPNTWLRTVVSTIGQFLPKSLYDKVEVLEQADIGLLLGLGNIGIEHRWVQWLADEFAK